VQQCLHVLRHVLLPHLGEGAIDDRRVVAFRQEERIEAAGRVLLGRRRRGTVGLLPDHQAVVVELLHDLARLLDQFHALDDALVGHLEIGLREARRMALRAGADPGFLPVLEPLMSKIVGDALERQERPTHLAHDVVAVLAVVFEVAALAGGRRLPAFFHRVLQPRVPVPLVAVRLVHGAVLRRHVVLVLVVIDAVVAGGARLRLARLHRGELVARVAVVALGLVGVAHRAAGSDLALRQRGPGLQLHVGHVVHGVRRMSVRPLLLRPHGRVALRLGFGELPHVAGAADRAIGQT